MGVADASVMPDRCFFPSWVQLRRLYGISAAILFLAGTCTKLLVSHAYPTTHRISPKFALMLFTALVLLMDPICMDVVRVVSAKTGDTCY